jgi:hypothetical protein
MAIRLINQDERFSKTIDGATFHFRRIPSFEQAKIEHKYTRKGVEQKRDIVDSVLEYAVLGWDGVVDHDNNPILFRSELVKMLPEEAKAALLEEFYASDPSGRALGN